VPPEKRSRGESGVVVGHTKVDDKHAQEPEGEGIEPGRSKPVTGDMLLRGRTGRPRRRSPR